MSPRRLSDEAKATQGTLRRHRSAKGAGEAVASLPVPPSLTRFEERQAFEDLVGLLAAEGKLHPSSAVALEAAARDLAMNRLAADQLANDGYVIVNPETGLRRAHPAAALLDQSSKRLKGWCVELGLTSASAGRVAAAPPAKPATFGALRRPTPPPEDQPLSFKDLRRPVVPR